MNTLRKLVLATLAAAFLAPSVQARVIVSDVSLFYRLFDASQGKPTAAQVQRDYLDAGSRGLRAFIPDRIGSADKLADLIARRPQIYAGARHCVAVLPELERRYPALIGRLKALYPSASAPDVTVVIGAANAGGTITPEAGVILSLEHNCQSRIPSTLPLDERFVAILAHEIVHTQQRSNWTDTVLATSLMEGIADFLGELMSGHNYNEHLQAWTRGKEHEIETRFRADMDKPDLSAWLYNGIGSPEAPGDLGYWIGYRIAKSLYERASDKQAAVKRLLEESDPKALLRDSGW